MIETPIENPEISIVIPVYNEEESLPQLFKELYPVMENLQRSFEIIFINDGSRDKSFAMLYDFQQKHTDTVRVIDLMVILDNIWLLPLVLLMFAENILLL